jgi:D-alanine-D-alanine ligase
MSNPKIVILYGGVSSEREVSLQSGEAVAEALAKHFQVELIELNAEALPQSIRADQSIVFPALHGSFGEDGRLQGLLDDQSIHYCGSDASSSRICMDKAASKEIARELKITTPNSITFDGSNVPLADEVITKLGSSLVVKPAQEGSSIGLHLTENRSALGLALSTICTNKWLIEQRIRGRELTVGILNGVAMGVVEICSQSGIYDYDTKYSPGTAEYLFPAQLDSGLSTKIKEQAEQIFDACGCRDFGRVDFLLDNSTPYFLEINTLPGMTITSLLPKSALCQEYDFEQLAIELVAPAVARFKSASIK